MIEPGSVELLIYETPFERLKGDLDDRVMPLVMNELGQVRRDGVLIAPEDVNPDVAWANRDMYTDGPVRDFMVSCLKADRLRWLQSSAAGFEHPIFAKLVGNGVTLTNSNASSVPIAEFVFAQVIQSFHPQQLRQQAQAEKRWETYDFRDVFGSTWVIYGLGHIGAELARRAQAFGVHVIGCRRTPVGDEPVDQMVRPDELLEVLPRADVVVLTAALSDENHHIVNAQFLELLQPGATLVNIGRGGLVDEAALLLSLEQAKPATAILDVFETEPLPEDSPFWEHPRVRLTGHCAGASDGTSWRGDQQFLENLGRFLDGRPLAMQVSELR